MIFNVQVILDALASMTSWHLRPDTPLVVISWRLKPADELLSAVECKIARNTVYPASLSNVTLSV